MLLTLQGKKRMQEMTTVAIDAGEQFSLALVQMLSKVKVHGVLMISYGDRTAHKRFQTSPIIGRSEPPPSWRGVIEII